MIISLILFGIYLFLIFLGRKQPDKSPFFKMAGYLVKKSPMKKISSEAVLENLKILHPLKAAFTQAEIYYKEKLAFVLTVVFVGNCLVFLTGVSNRQTSNLENNRIMRDSYEGQERFVKLLAAVGESKKELLLEIAPVKYDETQIEEIFDEMEEKLRKEILLDNESFDLVRSNLSFPESLEGYPVEIAYETDNYENVDIDGTVKISIAFF